MSAGPVNIFLFFFIFAGIKLESPVFEDHFRDALEDCLERDDLDVLKCILSVGERPLHEMVLFSEHSVLYLAKSAGTSILVFLDMFPLSPRTRSLHQASRIVWLGGVSDILSDIIGVFRALTSCVEFPSNSVQPLQR